MEPANVFGKNLAAREIEAMDRGVYGIALDRRDNVKAGLLKA
jgi:hypothetical protein